MADDPKRQGKQVPSIGRIVHYVLSDGPRKGQHRPAVIVTVALDPPTPQTVCALHVFLDKFDLGAEQDVTGVWQGTEPGTWHWPEYVPAQ